MGIDRSTRQLALSFPLSLSVGLALLLLASCRTHRYLRVESSPPGAVVRLDEEVIGTTPLKYEFVHGGQRRLSLYRPGYRTWSRRVDLEAPWYARFPFDLITELAVPLGLDHDFDFDVRLTIDTDEEESHAPAIDSYVNRTTARWAEERAPEPPPQSPPIGPPKTEELEPTD